MMPCHTRRRVLRTLAAVSIAGPAIIPAAQANPLIWALRTLITLGLTSRQARAVAQQSARALGRKPAQNSLGGVAAGMAARHVAFDVGQHLLTDNALANETTEQASVQTAQDEKDAGLLSGIEVWELGQKQTLFLKIPPCNDFIRSALEVVVTNIQTGAQSLIKKHSLALMPSVEEISLDVPVGSFNQPGHYQFDARIPALAGQIFIQGTTPVVIR